MGFPRTAYGLAPVQNAIVDWGWRAVHLSVLVGKEIVRQYYGAAANKSYYLGCSNGEYAYPYTFGQAFADRSFGRARWTTRVCHRALEDVCGEWLT